MAGKGARRNRREERHTIRADRQRQNVGRLHLGGPHGARRHAAHAGRARHLHRADKGALERTLPRPQGHGLRRRPRNGRLQEKRRGRRPLLHAGDIHAQIRAPSGAERRHRRIPLHLQRPGARARLHRRPAPHLRRQPHTRHVRDLRQSRKSARLPTGDGAARLRALRNQRPRHEARLQTARHALRADTRRAHLRLLKERRRMGRGADGEDPP